MIKLTPLVAFRIKVREQSRVAGKVLVDGEKRIFYRRFPSQLMRKNQSVSFDCNLLEKLEEYKINTVHFELDDELLSCPLDEYLAHAHRLNHGQGDQYYVDIGYLDKGPIYYKTGWTTNEVLV